MRLFPALLMIPLFASPVLADPPAPHAGRRTAEQHFADANITHDGKMTLDQAKAGYKSLVKSFDQIDSQHHGYITLDDIKAWKDARKAARKAAKVAASGDGVLLPGPAMRRGGGLRPIGTATDMVVPNQQAAPHVGVDLPATPIDGSHPS